ncbi:MAG: hypothetical protein J7J51_03085 [Candidatus Omnitrophica bacterium]|nr:hypothetical protein [Candidatus Omnitrophota bacterium]
MNELKKNIRERAEALIKKTIERARRIKEREFVIAKEKHDQLLLKGKERIDCEIKAKRNSLKAAMILEFRLKEENFKDSLAQGLLQEAKQALNTLDRDVLQQSLKSLIREAVTTLNLKKAHILINKRDETFLKEHYDEVVSFIREKVNGFENMEIDGSLNSYGGVVVRSSSSGEFFDNTFKRRFERFNAEFKKKILERLG